MRWSALVLRLVMARAFFVAGQSKVDGPVVPITVPGLDWTIASVTLPMSIKDGTYQMFDQLAALPLPSWFAAPVVCAIEFVVPICLVLGLGTRFCAIVLLVMTGVIQWCDGRGGVLVAARLLDIDPARADLAGAGPDLGRPPDAISLREVTASSS